MLSVKLKAIYWKIFLEEKLCRPQKAARDRSFLLSSSNSGALIYGAAAGVLYI